jgi:hypothetical protein
VTRRLWVEAAPARQVLATQFPAEFFAIELVQAARPGVLLEQRYSFREVSDRSSVLARIGMWISWTPGVPPLRWPGNDHCAGWFTPPSRSTELDALRSAAHLRSDRGEHSEGSAHSSSPVPTVYAVTKEH